jgi:phospholipid/cholesterol/gamma-HCH transport system permease protein
MENIKSPLSSPSGGDENIIRLPERLTARSSSALWLSVLKYSGTDTPIVIDASLLKEIDESGIALLYKIQHRKTAGAVTVHGLSPELQKLYGNLTRKFSPSVSDKVTRTGFFYDIGAGVSRLCGVLADYLSFIGEILAKGLYCLLHPRTLRIREILSVCETAGTDAFSIVCLIGFLMGIIIAFETALVARIFGAVIFVVNGIGVAMTRELGPLMTAILFAGRSGSAFAAQLGTQKVNEELNALTTFGLDPVRFLVLPRIIASTLMVPLLSIFATLVGIIGGGLVMGIYDISVTQFFVQLAKSVSVSDILFGVIKAGVFGFVIALIGSYCGLRTGAGAAAVGISTTRAVVQSIVWIVVIDGVAALLMNQLGI